MLSIQQDEKDNCWSEQSPKTKLTVPCFFLATRYSHDLLYIARESVK